MMSAYERFVRQLKDEFLQQFRDDPADCWIRVPNLNHFGHRSGARRWTFLPGPKSSGAVV